MKIPRQFIRYTLSDMQEGETAFTVPWALYESDDGNTYLDGNAPSYKKYREEPDVEIQVYRDTDDLYSVRVWKDTKFRWSSIPQEGTGKNPLLVTYISVT